METVKNKIERFSVIRIIVTALLFMMFGTVIELFLLHHYEGFLQLIPIICIGVSLVTLVVLLFIKTKILLNFFKFLLVVSVLSGIYGVFLHLQENFEFEKEMHPTSTNLDLLIDSFSGALPSLAPASMIVLSLIGYSYIKLIKQKP